MRSIDDSRDALISEIPPGTIILGVIVFNNNEDEPQKHAIPLEYDEFRELIGDEVIDVPIVERKIIAFCSKENSKLTPDDLRQFDKKIVGPYIIICGDEIGIGDLEDIQVTYFKQKLSSMFAINKEQNKKE